MDLSPLLRPEHSALVVFECLEGVIGPESMLPGLAAAARDTGMVPNIAGLAEAARRASVRVFYCTVERRADGVGHPASSPLDRRLREAVGGAAGGPDLGDVIAPLRPEPGDVVVRREHGLTGFYESGLDAYLRNTGVRTIALTGVSLNIGVLGTAIEAVNRGYAVVVPTDCVAADPPEYAEPLLRYSLRNLAYLSTAQEVAAHWSRELAPAAPS